MTHALEQRFPDVTFGNGVQLIGIANTTIGYGSCIGDDSWLNVCVRDDQPRLIIGDSVLIGRGSMLSSGGRLEIASFNLFAPRVYVSNVDHTSQDPYLPYLEQPVTTDRSLTVEENCWLGINAVITGALTVGRGSIIAAGAVVRHDVPPMSVVAGVPAKVLKMYNPESGEWEMVTDPARREAVEAARVRRPIPGREEYLRELKRRSTLPKIPPVLAGRGESL